MTFTPGTAAASEKARLRARLRAARQAMSQQDRALQSEGLTAVVLECLASGRTARPAGPEAAAGATDGTSAASSRGANSPALPRPVVAAFLGVDPEPDTVPMLTAVREAGFDVVVPVCEPDRALSWTQWRPGVALKRSALAPVNEPTGPRLAFDAFPDVRLLLVPALGVDTTGHRIGHGGGYYDRFLGSRTPASSPDAAHR